MTYKCAVNRIITYVLRDCPEFGLAPGFCIMGLREPYFSEAWLRQPDHTLKVWAKFYDALAAGAKTFELRRDDREPKFAPGQLLMLEYYDPGAAIRAVGSSGATPTI